MSKIVYKLTDQDIRTYGGYQWDIGTWHKIDASIEGKRALCSGSWFHCYSDPDLAVQAAAGGAL